MPSPAIPQLAAIFVSTAAAGAACVGEARAQEVPFETAADMPVLVSPEATPEDRVLRLAMHGNVERKSRIFYLGLGVSALLSPDALYAEGDGASLRTSFGLRIRSVTVGAPGLVARRVAVIQPAIFGEVGSRLEVRLGGSWTAYARWALRVGGDVTRVPAEDLGLDEHDEAQAVSAFILSPHLGAGLGWGPFQLGAEVDVYEVVDEAGPSKYAQILEGRAFFGLFGVFRLSRQVFGYFRALPFEGLPLQYTWGIAAVMNPDDP